jgi:hypothetical protein
MGSKNVNLFYLSLLFKNPRQCNLKFSKFSQRLFEKFKILAIKLIWLIFNFFKSSVYFLVRDCYVKFENQVNFQRLT